MKFHCVFHCRWIGGRSSRKAERIQSEIESRNPRNSRDQLQRELSDNDAAAAAADAADVGVRPVAVPGDGGHARRLPRGLHGNSSRLPQ